MQIRGVGEAVVAAAADDGVQGRDEAGKTGACKVGGLLAHLAAFERPGYRRFPHESHVVFYKIEAQDIFVVRVLHKSMDAVRNLPD